jgi:cell wall-associated NlpC family hydrolase
MTVTATELDITDLGRQLTLVSQSRKTPAFNLTAAISPDATLTTTIDGASTLDVPVLDVDRALLRSPAMGERCWIVLHDPAGDIHFELVGLSKSGDTLTVHFEDAIAAALRRQDGKLTIGAGKITIPGLVHRLVGDLGSKLDVDVDEKTQAGAISTAVKRNVKGSTSKNSWDLLGEVVGPVKWRRFSTGRRLVVGADPWLLGRKPALHLAEFADGVGSIDFDWDKGQPKNDVTVPIDARLLQVAPGDPVRLGDDMGPIADTWLASTFTRPLSQTRGTLTLTRETKPLHEPKPAPKKGNTGDPNYLPGQTAADPGGVAGNAQRARFVAAAMSHAGAPYVYGEEGPGYDCSGLMQAASIAAGKPLPRTADEQAGACAAQHRIVSVAEGLATRGALLFRLHGGGVDSHVAMSLGNGTTFEARGTAYPIGVFGYAASGGWTSAGIWI